MYEGLKIDTQKSVVLLGDTNGTLKEIELKQFEFLPQIGDKVEIFESENNTFIKKSAANNTSQNNMMPSVKGNMQPTEGVHVWPHSKAVWIKVFLVIGCIISFLCYILPFFIALPLTIICWTRINSNIPISLGVKIPTLLFTSIVSGVLLLTENDGSK